MKSAKVLNHEKEINTHDACAVESLGKAGDLPLVALAVVLELLDSPAEDADLSLIL